MPIRNKDVPKTLETYLSHGVDLTWEAGAEHATADCPFCGRDRKFTVNISNGLWRCFVCGEGSDKGGGNALTFIRSLWRVSDSPGNFNSSDAKELADERGLLQLDTLMQWGVCRSVITHNWLVPAYTADGKLSNLYKYTRDVKGMKLYASKGIKHQTHGVDITDNKRKDVYVFEGPWDAMVFWEAMRMAKKTDEGLAVTGSPSNSLLAKSLVIAMPGANVITDGLFDILADNDVYLMYDSDHPREHNGKQYVAGYDGMRRIVENMVGRETTPRNVFYLHWGDQGYNPQLKDGYDVRDYLTAGTDDVSRVSFLASLLDMTRPIPPEWVAGRSKVTEPGKVEIIPKPCHDFKTLNNAWIKAMAPGWSKKSKQTLIAMLSTVLSTDAPGGSQLWLKVIGPPSCGKTTLCEALNVAKDYILSKSVIKGFHSGYQTDKNGVEDNSLVAQIDGKTLVTKDGDTLVKSESRDVVLSDARDLYDGAARTYYKNKMSKDYENHRFTWIICGTDSIREIDESEVGERFLDVVMMETIDEDVEDEILVGVANRAARDMGLSREETQGTRFSPELLEAMQLTGGYVVYLRENSSDLLKAVQTDAESLYPCTRMGKFVAFARARPSKTQDEHATREFAPRLVTQTVRMAICAAAVMNKTEIDADTMELVHKISMDTSRGKGLDVLQVLYDAGPTGYEAKTIHQLLTYKPNVINDMLRFMLQIKAIEWYPFQPARGQVRTHWRLTTRMRKLHREVAEASKPKVQVQE